MNKIMTPIKRLFPLTLLAVMLSACQDTNTVDVAEASKENTSDISSEQVQTQQPKQEMNVDNAEQSADNDNKLKAERTFDYTPKAPVNGTKMGVGAVGSSELTSLVVEIDNNDNWKLLNREDSSSLLAENLGDANQLKVELRQYLKGMEDEGVNTNNMHFIISSGAQQKGNADKLIELLKSSGYVVNIINAEQEGKYAFDSTVPSEYRTNSFMVDIGSGNTKISWQQDGEIQSVETYGAKYFNDGIEHTQVNKEVKDLIAKIPAENKENAFIIGGVPYYLANRIRADDERYVVLNRPESYQTDSKKAESGLNIYKSMVQSTGADTKYIFDYDSHYAIGFLESL